MRRFIPATLTAAVAATLVAGSLLPGAASAQESTEDLTTTTATSTGAPGIGVNFHATWGDYNNQQRLAVLDKLAAAGVEWVRVDLGWSSFEEQCKGCIAQWYVDVTDFVVNAARERGIKVLGMLHRTPAWANGGAGVYSPPDNPADYANFAGWAAEYFKGRISAWQVWNEPNHSHFWKGTVGQYVRLLQAAYPKIKAGDPGALVVLGGPSYNDTGWLLNAYERGMQGSFDVLSTHPYQGIADQPPEVADPGGDNIWVMSHVAAVKKLMNAFGDGTKKIWFTEFGWSAHSNKDNEPNWSRGVTLAQQADYYIRALEFIKENFPYVTNTFWYVERNEASGFYHMDNYGLLNRDLSAKPVYRALSEYTASGSTPKSSTSSKKCTIRGSRGDDVLVGTPGRDAICAGGGNDEIRGRGGDDVIYGGPGNDLLIGQRGHDVLIGGGGKDRLRGGPGRDRLKAGRGADRLVGRLGRNELFGARGRDVCWTGPRDSFRGCFRVR